MTRKLTWPPRAGRYSPATGTHSHRSTQSRVLTSTESPLPVPTLVEANPATISEPCPCLACYAGERGAARMYVIASRNIVAQTDISSSCRRDYRPSLPSSLPSSLPGLTPYRPSPLPSPLPSSGLTLSSFVSLSSSSSYFFSSLPRSSNFRKTSRVSTGHLAIVASVVIVASVICARVALRGGPGARCLSP